MVEQEYMCMSTSAHSYYDGWARVHMQEYFGPLLLWWLGKSTHVRVLQPTLALMVEQEYMCKSTSAHLLWSKISLDFVFWIVW